MSHKVVIQITNYNIFITFTTWSYRPEVTLNTGGSSSTKWSKEKVAEFLKNLQNIFVFLSSSWYLKVDKSRLNCLHKYAFGCLRLLDYVCKTFSYVKWKSTFCQVGKSTLVKIKTALKKISINKNYILLNFLQRIYEIWANLDFRQQGPVQFPDILIIPNVWKLDVSLDRFR